MASSEASSLPGSGPTTPSRGPDSRISAAAESELARKYSLLTPTLSPLPLLPCADRLASGSRQQPKPAKVASLPRKVLCLVRARFGPRHTSGRPPHATGSIIYQLLW